MNDRYYYARSNDRCSGCGSRLNPVYKKVKDEKGFSRLTKVADNDIQAVIDSYAREVDIKTLINRYSNGDTSVFNRAQGVFADFTNLPDNMTSAFEIVERAKSVYNRLDDNAKREVGSFGEFLGAINTLIDNPVIIKPQEAQEVNHES